MLTVHNICLHITVGVHVQLSSGCMFGNEHPTDWCPDCVVWVHLPCIRCHIYTLINYLYINYTFIYARYTQRTDTGRTISVRLIGYM